MSMDLFNLDDLTLIQYALHCQAFKAKLTPVEIERLVKLQNKVDKIMDQTYKDVQMRLNRYG